MSHLRLILRGLYARRSRSLLTALGIAIGVTAFVSLVSLAESFGVTMHAMFASRRTDVSVVRSNSPDVLMSSLPEEMQSAIAAVPGVAAAAPVLADMLWAEERPASMTLGLAPGTFLLDHFQILEGRGLSASDSDVAMIGRTLATRIHKGLGDEYEVESHGFRIVGIYDAGNSLENSGAVLPLHRLQWLLNREGEITAVNLRIADGFDHEAVIARIRERFRNVAPIRTNQVTQSNAQLKLAEAMSWATSLVALAIGLIGTLNSMMMSVIERTREIGLLRAVGWRQSRICALLLGESVVLSLAGALLGLGLGAGALRLALAHPKIQGVLTAALDTRRAVEAIALALALGILGGLLPALRGARMHPSDALRYE